jgi:hypothetical protein
MLSASITADTRQKLYRHNGQNLCRKCIEADVTDPIFSDDDDWSRAEVKPDAPTVRDDSVGFVDYDWKKIDPREHFYNTYCEYVCDGACEGDPCMSHA